MGKTTIGPDPDLDAKLDDAFGASTRSLAPVSAPPAVTDDPRMGIPEGWPMAPTLISRVLADVGPVLKTGFNETQKYNFRGIDQVVNAVNAAFKRHRIFPTSKIEFFQLRDAMTTTNKPTREATLRVVYRFTAPDGSHVETEVPGEALDTSDKTTPKAMSVALRIALLQMLLLPTDEPTTDHEYLTRDGVGAMSPSVSAYLLDRLTVAPLPEVVGPIRAMISEHSAWDRPTREGQATWAANFADRLAWIIDEAADQPTLTDIHKVLDAARLLNVSTQAGTMVDHLKARWTALGKLYAQTLDHVMARIMAAQGQDELDIAIGCGEAAVEAGSLPAKSLQEALVVAEDRRAKLPEFAPQEEPGTADEAAEVLDSINADLDKADDQRPALDSTDAGSISAAAAYEAARHAFALRAAQAPLVGHGEEASIGAEAVYREIVSMLEGDADNPPASYFGSHGLQLVQDAITAAHRREHTIGDETRAGLDQLLATHRDMLASRQQREAEATTV